jgi:hypothetical protein
MQWHAPHLRQFVTRPSAALAALFHLFLLILAETGLFTPEEYAARQKEVQDQANSSAAAVEEQKEAARREQSLEIQVARTRAALTRTHSLQFQRKKALREAALKKMSFDIDDE